MSISARAAAAMRSQFTSDGMIVLLTFDSHGEVTGDPFRITNNSENVDSNGETFLAMGFDISLLSDEEETIPDVTVSVCNVDRSIVNYIRSLQTPAEVTIQAVLIETPDTIEVEITGTKRRDTGWNSLEVTGKLRFDDLIDEPFPGESMTPNLFPGLF